jgi:hypothetical protein
MSGHPEFHVLTRDGDASREVEEAVRTIGTPEQAGLHRYFFVSRAHQTVVMTQSPDAPLARSLRGREGWREPGDEAVA